MGMRQHADSLSVRSYTASSNETGGTGVVSGGRPAEGCRSTC